MNSIFALILQIQTITLKIFASESGPSRSQIFRMGNTREIESLDPAMTDGSDANIIVRGIFEGLVSLDPKTLQVLPAIAKTWSTSSNGLVYTFQLDPLAKWTNGRSVTAEDFVFAWKRNLDPATGALYAYYLETIAGASEFRKMQDSAKGNFASVGVKARDEHTLVVTLASPAPYFIELLSFPVFFPLPKEVLALYGKQWTSRENLVSNGAFKLKEWKLKEKLILQKNPLYREQDKVRLEGVEIYPIEDPKTAWNMYQAGQLDWIRILPSSMIPKLRLHPEFHSSPGMNTVYLRFNTKREPMNDPRVRRAISMALDRQTLTDKVLKEGQIPAYTFVAEGIPSYSSIARISEDISRARELLTVAGFPNGKNFPPLTLLFPSNAQSEKLVLAVSTMLKRALNIGVSPGNLERGVFYDRLGHLKYDMARSDWTLEYMDPKSYLEKFTGDNASSNLTGYADANYDELIKQAANIQNPARRLAAFARAEKKLVIDDAVIVPLYYSVSSSLWKPYISGLEDNPRFYYSLKTVAIGQNIGSF